MGAPAEKKEPWGCLVTWCKSDGINGTGFCEAHFDLFNQTKIAEAINDAEALLEEAAAADWAETQPNPFVEKSLDLLQRLVDLVDAGEVRDGAPLRALAREAAELLSRTKGGASHG